MRRFAPIFVILAALGLYATRHTVLKPFMPRGPSESRLSGLSEGGVAGQTAPDAVSEPASLDETTPPVYDRATAAAPPIAPGEARVPAAEPTECRIRKNSSLYVELRRIGVTPQEIDKMVRAARGTYDLKRVRAGQKFDVFTAADGSVDSLFFYFDTESHLGLRRYDPDNFVASIDTVPYTVTYHVTEGTIDQSVFVTLREQGAETELATHMAEIFGWTIDFFTDIRRGDSFAVLYERKSYENGQEKLGDVLAACVNARGVDYYAFRFDTAEGRSGYYDELGHSLEKSLRRAPVKFTRITSNFSHRRFHPINKRYQPHYGCDFGAPRGTPVYATGDGTVVAATRRVGNGNYVKIKHNNVYTTYYLHLQRFAKGIRSGKRVKQGQVIGYVGSTGWANGPHVCYRIKKNGSWVNPRTIKLPSKEPVPKAALDLFRRTRDAYLLRLNESILDGVENRTILVERPTYPAATHVLVPF